MTAHAKIEAVEPFEAPLVLIECRAADGQLYFPERSTARSNLKDVIADIRSGEETNIHAVYEVGRAIPITEDVAREILSLELEENNGLITDWLEPWLAKHLGPSRILSAEYADREWRRA